MKYHRYINAQGQNIFGLFLLSFLLVSMISFGKGRDIYQIKVYSLESEQQEQRMDKFLKDAYIPALGRAGIKHVGVLKPIEEVEQGSKKIYVLIPLNL